MTLIISISYIVVLAIVLLLAKLSKSKYAKTKNQQLNIMVVFHAIVAFGSAVIYFLQYNLHTLYLMPFNTTIRAFFGLIISYSIVSTYYYLVVIKHKDMNIIFHHVSSSVACLYITLSIVELPAFWGMVVLTQVNPIFYHTYLILKETEGVDKNLTSLWYDLNYYMWIIVRVILLSIWVMIGIYWELTNGTMDIASRFVAFIFILLMLYFSVNWTFIILRNRKKLAVSISQN